MGRVLRKRWLWKRRKRSAETVAVTIKRSEADWALLKAAGREISKPGDRIGDRIKEGLGVDFSPANCFNNGQYFLVSTLDMPR